MRKHRNASQTHSHKSTSSLLPIDTRILPNIISFGHVKGIAKVFLQLEIAFSTLVVLGTLVLVAFRFF